MSGPYTVEITIPASLQPRERGELYDLPLSELFDRISRGDVVGGGSRVTEGAIKECAVEFEIDDIDSVLGEVIAILKRANSPEGTRVTQILPTRKDLFIV